MESSRKRKSNEARLQAMEDHVKRMERTNNIISESLKGRTIPESKHVTFDSDSDDNIDNKVNGNKHKDIFGEDDSESDTEYQLPDKPQFEGYSGAKLFKLQQQSRNDDRFQLDERFAEALSEKSETGEKLDTFVVEKQKNLQILGDILGKDIRAQKRSVRDIVDLIRFDPTLDCHKRYILQKEDRENTDVVDTSLRNTSEIIEIPEVSKQTYYKYENTKSIASLFGKTQSDDKIETGRFNFDIKESEQVKLSQTYSFERIQVSTVSQLIDTEYHFAKDSESELGNVESRNVVEETGTRNFFFFHTNNSKFRNRIDDIKFYRKQDIDTLNREWHEKAALLMRDCKRKHRDAIRWKRKIFPIK
ncbi:Nucleolar protein 8 [Oopsacas minuta]|uniref:Nucleolar protein 8 n=1 Tax=Oopsacas minuta TaxID=111878 RepID=A0AAV7K0H6_9METZ|nr:Nucleolar protein 8 [Oopsacas minuta]